MNISTTRRSCLPYLWNVILTGTDVFFFNGRGTKTIGWIENHQEKKMASFNNLGSSPNQLSSTEIVVPTEPPSTDWNSSLILVDTGSFLHFTRDGSVLRTGTCHKFLENQVRITLKSTIITCVFTNGLLPEISTCWPHITSGIWQLFHKRKIFFSVLITGHWESRSPWESDVMLRGHSLLPEKSLWLKNRNWPILTCHFELQSLKSHFIYTDAPPVSIYLVSTDLVSCRSRGLPQALTLFKGLN